VGVRTLRVHPLLRQPLERMAEPAHRPLLPARTPDDGMGIEEGRGVKRLEPLPGRALGRVGPALHQHPDHQAALPVRPGDGDSSRTACLDGN